MAERFYTIERWANIYVEAMEQRYGREESHPFQDIEEMNLEWIQKFMDQGGSFADTNMLNWVELYMDQYETLYGPVETQPLMTVEELNQVLRELFYDSEVKQVLMKIA